jgi:hypothetical protein
MSAIAHRVAPQVGQGIPVNWRNQHFGQGNPKANQSKQLPAVAQEMVRNKSSKSVSRGANGRAQSSPIRLLNRAKCIAKSAWC